MSALKLVQNKTYLKADSDENKAINAYLNSMTGKFGQYFALPNALVYRRITNDYENGTSEVCQSIVAMDINGLKIGNSSILPMLGARKNWGNWSYNNQVTSVQTKISEFITMVPFTVFDEAQLDIRKLNMLEKLNDETVQVSVPNPKYKTKYDKNYNELPQKTPKTLTETRHFTGASLFEIEGRYFMFDIDREEIKHKIFNPFLVEVPRQVSTVQAAYDALVPDEVKDAEAKGLKVERQGEWFFIPVTGDYTADTEKDWNNKIVTKRITLQAGPNRPNHAEMGVESKSLVKGKVDHSGREHRTITLKTWHKAVPNTATRSFTITGNID